jgi:pyridoxine kinase
VTLPAGPRGGADPVYRGSGPVAAACRPFPAAELLGLAGTARRTHRVNILSFQSTVAYGRVGHRAAVLPLERLGHEVWPVDTVAFSNHPGRGRPRGRIVPAAEVADLVAGLEDLGVLARCDAVLSGYLGEPATAAVVARTVTRIRRANPGALYCCDPVLGEVGRGVYVQAGLVDAVRDGLVPGADIVTPNAFELELLAGQPAAGAGGALAAAEAVRGLGARLVVATGLRLPEAPDQRSMLAVGDGRAWLVRVPARTVRVHGTGDAFAALFLGAFLRRRDVPAALAHAAAALDAVLAVAEATGADELPLVAAQEALVHPPAPYAAEPVRQG